MAEWTGLEPATPGVTGRYSNQLNYRSEKQKTWDVIQGTPMAGGCCGARTCDLRLVRATLSQLS